MTDVAPATAPRETSIDLGRLAPGDAARLLEIVWTLASNGLLVVARRNRRLVIAPQRQAPKALAVALRRSFAQLGPTFVKFGQVVASSPGLFPRFLADEFRRLLDDVPPEPADRIRRTLQRELGGPVEALFASFDDTPIAAASVAQVHRATLKDGTEVAVKVRRPHLRRRAERDLRLMRMLALVLERMGAIGQAVNPVAVVDDFADTLRLELDLRVEATSMGEFAANLGTFEGRDLIVVPRAIGSMVTERVLVMTYITGTPVDDADTLLAADHDIIGMVRAAVRAWVEGALEHGLFHGDVHAGNLFITPAGHVAFLDFGIMGRLDPRTRGVLKRALPAVLIDGDYRAVVQAIFDLGAADEIVDIDAATEDVRAVLEPLATVKLGDLSYGEVLQSVLTVATRYRVKLPRELVLIVKQLLYFERYALALAPDYPLLADPYILQQFLGSRSIEVVRPDIRTRPVTRAFDEPSPGLAVARASDVAFSWVYDGARHDLTKLYEKAKRSQWNATTDIDWSIDVDPLATDGMTAYLPLLASDAFGRFTEAEQANAAHHFNAWITSQFMHGEQGALLATAKLVEEVPSTEAKFYGATQVVDEARHVEAYSRYLAEKLEMTYPVNPNLRELLELIVADSRWDVTYLGMQIVVEGIALAAFGMIHQFSTEPLIKQIT
ncbi:MAG: hypothetical protein JO087_13430, partial [Actinobacteria bacterium]|nr:hypothetical protein [Actinomycetota bacterium]